MPKAFVPLKSISNTLVSSGMALTKRTCAELPELQLVVMRVRPTRANVTRASVRGRAFNERNFNERNFNQHNMAFSKRQFWWWVTTWDASIVISGFTGVCKILY